MQTDIPFVPRERVPMRTRLLAAALSTMLTMVIPMANSAPTAATAVTDPAQRDALVAASRAPAEKELGAGVKLAARSVATQGDWAFVLADLQGADGRALDYAHTPRAEEAKRGLLSHRYAALLQKKSGAWAIVASAVGPTDPAWLAWPSQYGAPESLFDTGD